MSIISFSSTGIVGATADDVYNVLADYRKGHPAILPPENFGPVVVESGGFGAGTVIRFSTKVLGSERFFRSTISEPVPGRVLVESDTQSPTRTTFTIAPLDDGRHTRVTFTTQMQTSPGVQGLVERLIAPPALRRVYAKELKRLDEYLQKRPTDRARA